MIAHRQFRPLIVAAVLAWSVTLSPAQAAVPLGGLAVAVSPKGDKLVAAGDTRTLLVIDPQSLAVKERIWIETTVVRLAFDKAGTTLAVQDTDDKVTLYDTAGWKKKKELPRRELLTTAFDGDVFAALERSRAPTIFIHSLADGAEKGKFALPAGSKVASFGLSPDGKRLAVLIGPTDSTAEPKVASKDIPKGLRGAERDEFTQKNDGKVSQFVVYDVASGKPLVEKTLFYTSAHSNTQTVIHGDSVIFVNYNNVGAKVTQGGGAVAIFNGQNSYNYGIGTSADNGLILTGGLRKFTLTKPDTLAGVKGEIPRLPGWPEYFKSFDATPGAGAIYGATSAYRLVKLGADGKVLAIAPAR